MSSVKISREWIAEKLNLYLCPALLGISICYFVLYALDKNTSVFLTVLFAIETFGLFLLFDKLKRQKVLGGLIYTAILIAVIALSIFMVYLGLKLLGNWQAAMLWFYGLDASENYHPLFLAAVFLGGGFFIISVLYYFTQIKYRTLSVMLCILFPFVIYSRRSESMPDLMTTIIVMLYLGVVIHNKSVDPSKPKNERIMMKIDRSYIMGILIFVTVTGTVTMIIKKPVYISELERNTDLFNNPFGGNTVSRTSAENTSNISSPRYGGEIYPGEPLFYFETNGSESIYYLRRQPYQKFNGDVWEIGELGRYKYFSNFYAKDYPEYGTDDILNDMESVLQILELPTNVYPRNYINKKHGRIYDDTFNPNYLPAPLGTTTDDIDSSQSRLRKYPYNEIFLANAPQSNTNAANSNGIDESFDFYEHDDRLYDYALRLNLTYYNYTTKLSISRTEESQRLLKDYELARKYYLDTSNISKEVSELALSVTKDYYSDMEKALVLENYFEENGYVYDEEYIPQDQSIEYFIFEGKTGVCSSYATAMTLMARCIGLPARYVEGYAAFEKIDPYTFLVRDKYAHAFVEVYIPGTGWLTFDPTVSDYMKIPEQEKENLAAAFLKSISKTLVLIIVTIFIILSVLRDRIAELFFRITQLFRNPKKRTLKLYANVIKLINFSTKENYNSYTVNMLRDYISSTRGKVPEKLFVLFERTAFGGYEPTKKEYREAYREYCRCYRVLRKKPKKLKQIKQI